MKKVANVDKKKAKKEDKVSKKVRSKNQSQNIKRLALNSSQVMEIGIFKEILSDLLIAFDKHAADTDTPSILMALLRTLLTESFTFSNKKTLEVKY